MNHLGKTQELLQLINRKEFDELCKKWEMDKGIRTFTTWEQTCTHIVAFVVGLKSLREISAVLGISKSTLSDANTKRPHGFFQELCELVLKKIKLSTSNRKIKGAVRDILALDTTECQVHGSLSRKDRKFQPLFTR